MDPCPNDRRARARGQALLEFALLLPVLLLLTLGVIDGARVFTAFVAVTNASREAALFASRAGYLAWCRDPADLAQKAPEPAISVTCPSGTTPPNYFSDPDNVAYHVAAEAYGLQIPDITVDAPLCDGTPCSTASATAQNVTVTVRYRIALVTPFLGGIWGDPVVVTASTTARIFQ